MQTANALQAAYRRTALQREGISFDKAMATPMFKRCLQHIADAMNRPYVPLPKHATSTKWQPYKD